MALSALTRLGPYEILGPLGAGGMGEVYKARDTRLDRTVAIKILPEALAADPRFRERFDREARTISQLDHPHICALYDVGEQNGTSFLVMQYLEGQTLADRITAKGALPINEALAIAIQIADGLDKAHRAGVTHRDLKPGNIMLTKAGAKLLDFGLAKTTGAVAAAAGLSMLTTTPPKLTAQGTILGTFQYMAPEQLEGQEADTRTDVFAFGAVLYEMLSGKKAFRGKTQAALIHAIMGVDPNAMAPTDSISPPVLDHVVKRCLAKNPEDRWQSAADLRQELKWISEMTVASPAPAVKRLLGSAPIGWSAAAVLLATLIAALGLSWVKAAVGEVGLRRLKVAVFYPDPSRPGPAYEDGAIQQSGFRTAYDEFTQRSALAQEPAWNPYLLPQDNRNISLRDALLPRIQQLHKEGYRVFILTMSAAAQDLRPVFESWRRQLPEREAPILISTVASAPNIANRADGILRFYVRSEEEANELSRFAAWKQGLKRLGVFYVTDSAERPNAYGYGGFSTVLHEFGKDLHGTVEPHPVFANGLNASAEVAKFVATAQNADVGAFIIGYDTMLKETLKALIVSRFAGPILTTSTLTEPKWQPEDTSRDSTIYTAIPHRDEVEGRPAAESGVVYLFSKLTLASTLKCASLSSDVRTFVDCWERDTSEASGLAGVTHLSNGDTVIPMVVTNQWRARTPR